MSSKLTSTSRPWPLARAAITALSRPIAETYAPAKSTIEMPHFAMMGLFSWILMGLLAGAHARFFLPGRDAMGCIMTVITGVVGAVVGGFVATLLGFGGFEGFDLYSLIIATVGAILFLLVLRMVRGGDKSR